MDEESAVFLDGGFLDKVLEKFVPPKFVARGSSENQFFCLDYEKFANELCRLADTARLRTYYYHCKPLNDGSSFYTGKVAFFNALTRTPRFQFREGKLSKHRMHCKNKKCGAELVCPACGKEQWDIRQKRTDDLLMVDVVSLSWRGLIKKAILVGGDSDFVPAFREAKEAGVITYLFYVDPPRGGNTVRVHDELYDIFDERIELTPELIRSCGKYKKVVQSRPETLAVEA